MYSVRFGSFSSAGAMQGASSTENAWSNRKPMKRSSAHGRKKVGGPGKWLGSQTRGVNEKQHLSKSQKRQRDKESLKTAQCSERQPSLSQPQPQVFYSILKAALQGKELLHISISGLGLGDQ